MTDDADHLVVLAFLWVAFLGMCEDEGLGSWGGPFSCLPDLVADFCESSDCSFTASPTWTISAGMLSTPADFLCIAASTSL